MIKGALIYFHTDFTGYDHLNDVVNVNRKFKEASSPPSCNEKSSMFKIICDHRTNLIPCMKIHLLASKLEQLKRDTNPKPIFLK